MPQPELVTSEQVAAMLHVGPAAVRQYARSGRIPFVTTPGGHRRYDLDAVRAALNGRVNDHVADPEEAVPDDVGDLPPKAVLEVDARWSGSSRAAAAAALTDHEWDIMLVEDGLG